MSFKYFKGIKEKDRIWDSFEKRIMIVESIVDDYFLIQLRSIKGNHTGSCTINGFDGIHRSKRYYWNKPIIIFELDKSMTIFEDIKK